MKRTLAIILALCMVFSVFPLFAMAEEVLSEEHFLLSEELPEIEDLILEEAPAVEEPDTEELLPEIFEEELLFTEELEEIEANEAKTSTVRSEVIKGSITGLHASIEIEYETTDAVVAEEWYIGIAHSTSPNIGGQVGDSIDNWAFAVTDYGPMLEDFPTKGRLEGDDARSLDFLVPNTTFYYFAFIADKDRVVVAVEDAKAFTTTNDISATITVNLNAPPVALPEGNSTLTFTPAATGLYAVVGQKIKDIDVVIANEEYIGSTHIDDEYPEGTIKTVFFGRAGETVYIFLNAPQNNGARVAVSNRSEDTELLTLNTPAKLHGFEKKGFIAPKAGWYCLTVTGDTSDREIGIYDAAADEWRGNDAGNQAVFKLAANELLVISGWFDDSEREPWTVTISELTPAASDSIVSASKPKDIGYTSARIDLTLNVTDATAAAGYRYGVFLSLSPTIDTSNYYRYTKDFAECTWESSSAANGQKTSIFLEELAPGHKYYYCGAIIKSTNDEIVFVESTVHSFTTKTGNDGITRLTLNTPAAVPAQTTSYYSFIPAETGIYMVFSEGLDGFYVYNEAGFWIGGIESPSDSYIYHSAFPAKAGETVYIRTGTYNTTTDATITIKIAYSYADAVTLGKTTAVREDAQLFSFTARQAGVYRVKLGGNSKSLNLYNPEKSDWVYYGASIGPIEMAANETIYFSTLFWNDEEVQKETVTVEKADDAFPDDNICKFVLRCYSEALGRTDAEIQADRDGVLYWYNNLKNQLISADYVGYYFVFSPEGASKGQSNNAFVTMLYRLYMNRIPDAGGLAYWDGLLNSGTLTRENVNWWFCESAEWQGIKTEFGMK